MSLAGAFPLLPFCRAKTLSHHRSAPIYDGETVPTEFALCCGCPKQHAWKTRWPGDPSVQRAPTWRPSSSMLSKLSRLLRVRWEVCICLRCSCCESRAAASCARERRRAGKPAMPTTWMPELPCKVCGAGAWLPWGCVSCVDLYAHAWVCACIRMYGHQLAGAWLDAWSADNHWDRTGFIGRGWGISCRAADPKHMALLTGGFGMGTEEAALSRMEMPRVEITEATPIVGQFGRQHPAVICLISWTRLGHSLCQLRT